MISLKRLSLIMLPAILVLLIAACGDDPTATPRPTATPVPAPEPTSTPVPAPDPTATPTSAPAPTATPEPEAMAGPMTYVLGDFVVEDGKFELRMGETAYFGYDAEQRIPTIAGLIEIVLGPVQVGDTIEFDRCRQSGSRSTKPNRLTIEGLGIEIFLSADEGGGTVGTSDDPSDNCVWGPFTAPGTFISDVSSDPGEHGVAMFVVEGEAMAMEGDAMMAEGVTWELDRWGMEDGLYQLRVGGAAAFGYAADARIDSRIVITVNAGDTISFSEIRQSSSRSTKNHHFAIAALGIDVETGSGIARESFSFTPDQTGTFVIDDPTDPGAHGIALLIVQ